MQPWVAVAESPGRSCPFLQALGWRMTGSVAREVTCAVSPVCLGPPSADELAWLCTNDHHYGCPRYRDGRRVVAASCRDEAPLVEARR